MPTPIFPTPTLVVEEIPREIFDSFLDVDTQKLLSKNLVPKDVTIGENATEFVRYNGVKGSASMDVKAIKKLARSIKTLCQSLKVIGSFGNPIKYDLVPPAPGSKASEALYLCYVKLTPEAAKAFDALMKAKFKY